MPRKVCFRHPEHLERHVRRFVLDWIKPALPLGSRQFRKIVVQRSRTNDLGTTPVQITRANFNPATM